MTEVLSPTDDLSLAQIRAARALLGWTQHDLADAACVGTSTVADFERGSRLTTPDVRGALRHALEYAGVEFIRCGVKLKPFCERYRAS